MILHTKLPFCRWNLKWQFEDSFVKALVAKLIYFSLLSCFPEQNLSLSAQLWSLFGVHGAFYALQSSFSAHIAWLLRETSFFQACEYLFLLNHIKENRCSLVNSMKIPQVLFCISFRRFISFFFRVETSVFPCVPVLQSTLPWCHVLKPQVYHVRSCHGFNIPDMQIMLFNWMVYLFV